MAYSSLTAILGSSGQPKRRRQPPAQSRSTPTAILGARGAQATAAARQSYDLAAQRRSRAAIAQQRFLARGQALAQRLPDYEEYVARQAKRDSRARERADRRYWDNLSTGEKLLEGGLVGLIDEDVSAGARKAIYGTEDPSAGQVALMTLPTSALAGARGGVATWRLVDAAAGRVAPRMAAAMPFHRAYTRRELAKEAALSALGTPARRATEETLHMITGNRGDEGLYTQSRRARDRLLGTDPFWRDLFR